MFRFFSYCVTLNRFTNAFTQPCSVIRPFGYKSVNKNHCHICHCHCHCHCHHSRNVHGQEEAWGFKMWVESEPSQPYRWWNTVTNNFCRSLNIWYKSYVYMVSSSSSSSSRSSSASAWTRAWTVVPLAISDLHSVDSGRALASFWTLLSQKLRERPGGLLQLAKCYGLLLFLYITLQYISHETELLIHSHRGIITILQNGVLLTAFVFLTTVDCRVNVCMWIRRKLNVSIYRHIWCAAMHP